MMRTVTVSSNFTFLIIGTRIGLVGKRKVYNEALLCTRHICSPLKKPKTKNKQKKKHKKIFLHQISAECKKEEEVQIPHPKPRYQGRHHTAGTGSRSGPTRINPLVQDF